MTTLYEKRGRRYVPVAERDTFDSWPHGAHLVVCKPGSRVVRFGIDADRAALIAAAEPVRDAIRDAVVDALAMRPVRKLTRKQAAAWEDFQRVMGKDRFCVEYASAQEVADKAVKIVIGSAAAARGNTGSGVPGRLGVRSATGLTADQQEDAL